MTMLTTPLDTITSLFWHSDHHEWDDLKAVFADRVRIDYTALHGGEPTKMTPAGIVGSWRPGFEAIDAHQHLVANHLVTIEDDTATATAAFIATHQWRDTTWTLGGDYRFELTRSDHGWKITAMTMAPVWQTGDPGLIPSALTHSGHGSTHEARNTADTATVSMDDQ